MGRITGGYRDETLLFVIDALGTRMNPSRAKPERKDWPVQRIRLESQLPLGPDPTSAASYLGRIDETGELVVLRELALYDRAAARDEVHAVVLRAMRLRDPRLVSTLGAWQVGDQPYLVSEFVPGLPFSQLLAQNADGQRCRPTILVHVVCEALRALETAYGLDHAGPLGRSVPGPLRRSAHGNITPWSIMITLTGQVRIADFGVDTRLAGPARPDGGASSKRWASPEKLNGERIDERSDVYSMGAVLWEALSQSFGEPTTSPASLFPPETSRTRPRDADAALLACCRRALDPVPSRRYATVAAFLDDLARYIRARGTGREGEELRSVMENVFPGSIYDVRRRLNGASVPGPNPEELMDIDEALAHDEVTTRTDLAFIARVLTGPPVDAPATKESLFRPWAALATLALVILVAFIAQLW